MTPRILSPDLAIRSGAGDVLYCHATQPLGPYPIRITDCLDRWAEHAPDRSFLNERDPATGEWRSVTYGEARRHVRALAQGLLARDLSPNRPIAILSGNSIHHALLGLAAMYCGVAYAPLAPAYSLSATRFDTLQRIWATLTPGLVFAAEGDPFARALEAVDAADTEIVTRSGLLNGRHVTSFGALALPETADVDRARDSVAPETIAKFLFTSGSTGTPKGVINTQRMLCANQEQLRTVLTFLADAPPVVCDWLPWNHTFGGNHNVGIVLYNGGTLYIDAGRPVPGAMFDRTLDNLRDVATTVYLNVPRGFDLLVSALRRDEPLRQRFFSRLQVLFCAAAAVKPAVAAEMLALAVETRGEPVTWLTGLGATETAPFCFCTGPLSASPGTRIGVPAPGVNLKVVPAGEHGEARLRGPNVAPGYWRDEALTAAAFDEEGYYKLGDLVRLVNPARPSQGFTFEGRLNENFKLSSGTWVRVGMLRQNLLAAFGDLALDVVIAAPDRDELTALVFPNLARCSALAGMDERDGAADALAAAEVRAAFSERLAQANTDHAGSALRVVRVALVTDSPSLDRGEITDKGSINQSAVLSHRAAVVEELYGARGGTVIVLAEPTEDLPA